VHVTDRRGATTDKIAPTYELDLDTLANLTLLHALLKYSIRWGLLQGELSDKLLRRKVQKKKFHTLEKDSPDKRVELFIAFKNLSKLWLRNKDHITDDSLKGFFTKNFTTNRQKEVLQSFLTKESAKTLKHSICPKSSNYFKYSNNYNDFTIVLETKLSYYLNK